VTVINRNKSCPTSYAKGNVQNSPWDCEKCTFGGISYTGKASISSDGTEVNGNNQPFSRCLPTHMNCTCLNNIPSKTWDGHKFPKCQFCDSKRQGFSGVFLAQCGGFNAGDIYKTDGTRKLVYDSSACLDGKCKCRFFESKKSDCAQGYYASACGDKTCETEEKGCIGCTSTYTQNPKGSGESIGCVNPTWNSAYANFWQSGTCATTEMTKNSGGPDNTYVCPDGTPCFLGDADIDLDTIISFLKEDNTPETCINTIKKSLRECAYDSSKTCINVSSWKKQNKVDDNNALCVTYNSVDKFLEANGSRPTLLNSLKRMCG